MGRPRRGIIDEAGSSTAWHPRSTACARGRAGRGGVRGTPIPAARPATPAEESALEHVEQVLLDAAHQLWDAAEAVLHLPEPTTSRWHRAGVTPRAERVLDVGSALLVTLFAIGWSWSIVMARSAARDDGLGVTPVTAAVAAAFTARGAPTAPFLTEAALMALTPLRGASGKLRAQIGLAGAPVAPHAALPGGEALRVAADSDAPAQASPSRPGIWRLVVAAGEAIRPVADFNVITLIPTSEKRGGRIGSYRIGSWPTERRGRVIGARGVDYSAPSGFIEVTRENQHTLLSEHFRLRDFLTHDQENVWPKYLVVDTRLVDKLELVLSELKRQGIDVSGTRVMSGFRTPQYNTGGGDARGRAALSRHMYGDAADIFIDSDGSGDMDDLNRDRRVNIEDARVIMRAVDRVERAHPELVGGCGVYVATSAHGPFIHIDTRGYPARWVGSGDG